MSDVFYECFDRSSLEAFTAELVASGFEPIHDTDRQIWRGPIHPAFAQLTPATTMIIGINPGWPFQPPALLVKGLNTNHSTLGGLVCMWRDGDASRRWTTLEGLFARIEEWCTNAETGWESDDLGHDALLNFRLKDALLATFDRAVLNVGNGTWGEFHGELKAEPFRLDLRPARAPSSRYLRGLWFHVGELDTPPPRELSEVLGCLKRRQRRTLERELNARRTDDALVTSGGVDLILFGWSRNGRPDLLVLACKGVDLNVEAIALQPGPNDEESLLLRAGPDAAALRACRAVVFGAGALGGHVAVALAESGLGSIDLVDDDVLSPGNVVRHVAGHDEIGATKVVAVEAAVKNHAPWTAVNAHRERPQTPSAIQARIVDSDVVVDATGDEAFTRSMAIATRTFGKPFVSGALYRGGAIGRIQREARAEDTPIEKRLDPELYPVIPVANGEEEFATPEIGCSAPVNNAPPVAVLACSSLIAQATVDVLTERFDFGDETIDVYRAIDTPPFDRLGRVDQLAKTAA